MQRLLFIIFSSIFLLFSCGQQKPDGILSENKAVDLFMEASLIDAYLNTLPIDSGRKVMPVLYDNLFKSFKIDSTTYKLNLDFYYGNPMLTDKIYTEVGKKLDAYDKKYRVEDSIRNVLVQDSIRYITGLQQSHSERIQLTMNYSKDTLKYTHKEDALRFFNRLNLNLNAYGIQTPEIQAPIIDKPVEAEIEESLPTDSTAVENQVEMKNPNRIPLEPVKDTIIKKDLSSLNREQIPRNLHENNIIRTTI